MSIEKREILFKCDCENRKTLSKMRAEITKKYFCIVGVVILVGVLISVSFFVQYTLFRINLLEDEVRRAEAAFNEMMKVHEDMYMFTNPGMLRTIEEEYEKQNSEKQNYDYDYEDYSDYQEYEPATNLTKDGKRSGKISVVDRIHWETDDEGKPVAKRSVVAATRDGVLINSESYAEIKAKNSTHRRKVNHDQHRGKSVTALPARPSAFGNTWPYLQSGYNDSNSGHGVEKIEAKPNQNVTEEPVQTKKPSVSVRRSRVMHRENPSKASRRTVKKPLLKSGDMEYDSYFQSGELTTTTEAIVKHKKLARTRPLITVQFNGDTSKYVYGKHENFKGNGHLRHPQRKFVDWSPSDWVGKTGMDSHFSLNQGVVTIRETGLYFVYAQIYYLDEHDTTGYRVFKNSNMILQCTITQHSSAALMKGNTCYTAGVEFLSAGDTIYLADITTGKYSLFEPGKSFFGLIKLGDFKNK